QVDDFFEQNDLHDLGPGSVVVVGVRQQGQEAGALDGGVQLALIVCLGTGQASGDDLAVLLDEIAQSVEILVIDLFNASCREAAELATLEQGVLLRKPALPVLSFLESHDVCLLSIRARPGICFYVHRAPGSSFWLVCYTTALPPPGKTRSAFWICRTSLPEPIRAAAMNPSSSSLLPKGTSASRWAISPRAMARASKPTRRFCPASWTSDS